MQIPVPFDCPYGCRTIWFKVSVERCDRGHQHAVPTDREGQMGGMGIRLHMKIEHGF